MFWTSDVFEHLATRRRFLGGKMCAMRGSSQPLKRPRARHRPSSTGTVEVQSERRLFWARGRSCPWLSSTMRTRVSSKSTLTNLARNQANFSLDFANVIQPELR